MSKDCSCGKDHDEYVPEHDPLVMSFMFGTMRMAPEALIAVIQTCVSEMYIRCPEGEFIPEWLRISDSIVQMFDPETTQQPEALEHFEIQRKALAEDKDKAVFIDSVMGDLQEMIGDAVDVDKDSSDPIDNVTDITKNVPKNDNDDYGNYL